MDSERKQKFDKIQELGIQVLPEKFLGKIMSSEALEKGENEELRSVDELKAGMKNFIRLAGRMMTFRSHGKLSFAQLQDFAEGVLQLIRRSTPSQYEQERFETSPKGGIIVPDQTQIPSRDIRARNTQRGDRTGPRRLVPIHSLR